MKKIFSLICICLIFVGNCFAQQAVNVYATVGTQNKPPRFISFNPSSNPLYIASSGGRVFEIQVEDPQQEKIYYSVSALSGSVNPTSGEIDGSGMINFTYYAPDSSAGMIDNEISITLNDTVNVAVEYRDIYVY